LYGSIQDMVEAVKAFMATIPVWQSRLKIESVLPEPVVIMLYQKKE